MSQQISFVTFVRPVTIGSHARESWSAKDGLNAPNHGKETVEELGDGRGLRFGYEAGPVRQSIVVPWANIGQVTRIPVEDPKPPGAQKGGAK